jgi:uncharacterized NAD(P)/FAD-binding protein YdhS
LKVIDSQDHFVDDETSPELIIATTQDIPEDFVSWLKKQKIESKMRREGHFMHVASLPTVVVHKYYMEGFDVFNEPFRETIKRLNRDGLDAFIVTNKRV